jgi:uncharacterized Zn finger protein
MAELILPQLLTENNIHNWVGEAQFNRAQQYHKASLIVPHSNRGRRIRGWCLPGNGGKAQRAYFVSAHTANCRIVRARCTCSIGNAGRCPHVAAVLLSFLHNPHSFRRAWWQKLMRWCFRHTPKARQRAKPSA